MFTDVVEYTVPAGKTLFVYDWSGGLCSVDGQVLGRLTYWAPLEIIGVAGGTRGFAFPLSKPKRVPSGNSARVALTHNVAGEQDMEAHLGGILI